MKEALKQSTIEDCEKVIDCLHELEGSTDETGEITTLGFLVGAIVDEIAMHIMRSRK